MSQSRTTLTGDGSAASHGGLSPTDEEQRLLDLLQDRRWWDEQAKKRGFRKVGLEKAELTPSGVVITLTLDGQDSLKDLEKKHDLLRVILDVRDEDLTDLSPSGRASRVLLSVRTRYITDELDMYWHPGITTLGRDTVTGEEVDVPSYERLLVGGTSGSGKSWSMRPLMARAVVHPQEELAGFIDGKGEESAPWQGICPCATTDEEIVEAIEREHALMERRGRINKEKGRSVWNLNEGPRRLLVIDEGYSVLRALEEEDKRRGRLSRDEARGEGEYDPLALDATSVMRKITELSSQGRSREIVLLWMTQNPLRSGRDTGISSAIRANFDYSFCLRVNTPANTEAVLGSGFNAEPHALPRGTRFRGYGYLNVHGSNLIRTWTVTNEMVSLLAYPDHGRGRWPRDVALKALRAQPGVLWTPELLASQTGCGRKQALCFLRSFSREGLVKAEGGRFRLTT